MAPVDLGAVQRSAMRFEVDGRDFFNDAKSFKQVHPFMYRDAGNMHGFSKVTAVERAGGFFCQLTRQRIEGVSLSDADFKSRCGNIVFPQLCPMLNSRTP